MALGVRALVAALERAVDGVEAFTPLAVAIADRGPSPGAVRADGEGARLLARQELGVGLTPLGAQKRHGVDALERREAGDRTRADPEPAGDRGGKLLYPSVVV